ncbi:hypothetical protein PspLS_03366 [Pyricularia sp. CBS 133598]|nr:hypothetical protein PspLS_03366 [Pyricularia sp. CBS 133598]
MRLGYMVGVDGGDVRNHRYGVRSSCQREWPQLERKRRSRGQGAAAAVRHSTQPKLGWLMECASRFAPFRGVPSRPFPRSPQSPRFPSGGSVGGIGSFSIHAQGGNKWSECPVTCQGLS